MSARTIVNVISLVVLVVAVSLTTRMLHTDNGDQIGRRALNAYTSTVRTKILQDGRLAVQDARGKWIVAGDYKRIVAASTIASEVAYDLIEPDRIAAWAEYAAQHEHNGWKFTEKPLIHTVNDTEEILSLRPDIFFFNSHANASAIARLEEHGVQVFDLGQMDGVESFLRQAEQIATVCNVRKRFERYAYTYRRGLDTIICKPIEEPEEILYVGMIGGAIFGGTKGTGYGDIITYAGLRDAAADQYTGWPQYSPEDLLALDPPWILVPEGTAQKICTHSVLRELRACADNASHMVELPASLLGDPGGAILPSASMLFDSVYGPCNSPVPPQNSAKSTFPLSSPEP